MPRQYMSSDEPREYMGGAAKQIHDVLTGGAKSRRPQVVKKPTTISRVPQEFRPIIDKVAPRPNAPVQEPMTVPQEFLTNKVVPLEFRTIIDKVAPRRYDASPRPNAPVQEPMTVAKDAPPYYLYSVDEYGNDIMSINPIYLNQPQRYYTKGSGRTRRPQVVKQSRQSRPVEPPIIDYAPPPPVYATPPPVSYDSNGEPPYKDYNLAPQNEYIDVIVPGGTQRIYKYRGQGSGRRRKHRSPSSSSDEEMEGGGAISSLFNIGRAVATAATKVAPKVVTTVTRGATTAENLAARSAQVAAAEAKAAGIARAAAAEAKAAEAAAAAVSKPASLGTRLMNTASGLGNFGILAANIGAPIYMSVDQYQNDLKADAAQRKAEAENARLAAIAAQDRLDALKVQDDMDKASKAQWEAYNLAVQILSGSSGSSGSSGTGTADPGAVIDILNTITAITNPPPTNPPTAPPPPGSGNPNVPIAPPPPQPPSIAPTQPTTPPTNLPKPTPPPPPPPPSAPVVPPSTAVPPSAPSRPPSNQYRGRGRGRRGGVTHESHKANILRILKAHNR